MAVSSARSIGFSELFVARFREIIALVKVFRKVRHRARARTALRAALEEAQVIARHFGFPRVAKWTAEVLTGARR